MNIDEIETKLDEDAKERNANPRTTDVAELRKEFVSNPTWAKTLFDGYMAERYHHRTGVNISALEWAHMRVKGLCIEVDRLRAYRKNARKSMRDMQIALERKNREIAELRNEAAYWFAQKEKLQAEKLIAAGVNARYEAGFWGWLCRVLSGRR